MKSVLRKIAIIVVGLVGLGAVALGVLAALQEDRHVNTAIVIDADLAAVWKVLGDTARYPEWNPYIRGLTGDIRRRGRIDVTLEIPDFGARRYTATLLGYTPDHELIWEHDLPVPRLFVIKHKLIIDPTDDGRVRLRHEEEHRGLLVGPLTESYLENKRLGFEAMNRALKQRVEQGG